MRKLTTDEMHRLSPEDFLATPKIPLVVVLDNIRSQNNIGSVFRTADAFAIEGICLCGICSTPPHRDIHKTALGAEDTVKWCYFEETSQCVTHLKEQGYMVFAIEQVHDSIMLNSPRLQTLVAHQRVAIVLGNEVEGVQEEVIDLCHDTIEIPQYGTKHSLNVSCTAAIVMWHLQSMMRLEQN